MQEWLSQVQKPSRYAGGEWNTCIKDPNSIDVNFAFCFPDTYEVGMSHLGMKILCDILNRRQDTYCQRVFAPWVDMERQLRARNMPLTTLESDTPLHAFDLVGFTLQYELCYTNILTMLDLGGIPLLAADRSDLHPIILAGGPCTCNPEPLADIMDLFVFGEGEEVIEEIVDLFIKNRKAGGHRQDFLKAAAKLPGVYVPSLYHLTQHEGGEGYPVQPVSVDLPLPIRRRMIADLENAPYPEKFIVPYAEAVHDRVVLEIFRGCTRGCRFCQAGMLYRPIRQRSVDKLMSQAQKLISSTGYEEIGLCSLSTGDYSDLPRLTKELVETYSPQKVSISLPSLRLDSLEEGVLEQASQVRKTGLTFAPEAGSQRLRDVINKNITQEDILKSLEEAFLKGWSSVKLYFMIGLPTETQEDLDGIVELAKSCVRLYDRLPRVPGQKGVHVGVSVSNFVPKPFTPFQWCAQDDIQTLSQKQDYLRAKLRTRGVQFSGHNPKVSFLETVFAKGDRAVGKALVAAWQKGCRFDAWTEHFSFETWLKAFEEMGIDPAIYANRPNDVGETLPWDHLDCGVTRAFLWQEYLCAKKETTTPDCRKGCLGCGIQNAMQGGCPMCE